MSVAPRKLRAGRRPGRPDTRGLILAAAGEEFGARAYDGTTMRAVAARAGVDAALVYHYFGTKDKLFLAVMDIPFEPAKLFEQVAAGPRANVGEQAVRAFFSVWDDPRGRAPMLAMLRSAMSHETAATLMRQFIKRLLLSRFVRLFDGVPDAELRTEAMVSQLVGIGVLRYVIKIEPIASASIDELVSLVAPVIQHYVPQD